MADIRLALQELYDLEFSNPYDALHKNEGENGLTFMGIYQTAHPNWMGWYDITYSLMSKKYIKEVSYFFYNSTVTRALVDEFYQKEFWEKMKLDKISSQQIANEIFIFGVNVGPGTAIRKAQALVGVVADGIIGGKTIAALNSFCEDEFDMKFDEYEIKHYEYLISKKPSFAVFKDGWRNRALAV